MTVCRRLVTRVAWIALATMVATPALAADSGMVPAEADLARSFLGLDDSGIPALMVLSLLMGGLWVFRFVRGIHKTARSLNKARGLLTPGESFEERMAAKMRELHGESPAAPAASAPVVAATPTAAPPPPLAEPIAPHPTAAPASSGVRTFGRRVG